MAANQTPTIAGDLRDRLGSKYAVRLRNQGKMPAVIYGHQQDPVHVALDSEAFMDVLHSGTHILQVDLSSGKSETCLIKDLQHDYLGDSVIHADLTRIDLSEDVDVSVSIELKGQDQCPGLKEDHALLEQPTTELDIRCRADAIPDGVTVDISALEVEGSITAGELTLPPGVELQTAEDTVIVAVRYSRAEEAEEEEGEEAVEEGAEPEVIAEKKDEDESEE